MFINFNFLLISCKKDNSIQTDFPKNIQGSNEIKGTNLSSRKSTTTNGDILDWLKNQTDSVLDQKDTVIGKVIENLQFDKLYVEKFNEEENIIVVPLKQDYISIHTLQNKQLPLEYLVLKEGNKGKIFWGSIIFFYPNDTLITSLPTNSFSAFYHCDPISVDGTFTQVSLEDIKQLEFDFLKGVKKQYRAWEGKTAVIVSSPTVCTEWDLVTTFYDESGEIIDEISTYLYTSCTGGGGGSTTVPDPNPTAPGGQGTIGPASATDIMIVAESINDSWGVSETYQFSGTTMAPNTGADTFDSMISSAPAVGYGLSAANGGQTWLPYYSVWSVATDTYGLTGSQSAWANVGGTLTFPNQQGNNVHYFSKTKTWSAQQLFH